MTWHFARIALITPLFVAIFAMGTVIFRLEAGPKRSRTAEIQVAATWLIDRLALVQQSDIQVLLEEAEERLDAHIGLFLSSDQPIYPGRFVDVPPQIIGQIFASNAATLKIGGTDHVTMTGVVDALDGRPNLLIAARIPDSTRVLSKTIIKLVILSVVLVFAAAMVGMAFGRETSDLLNAIKRRLEKIDETDLPKGSVPPVRPTPPGTLDRLYLGISRVVERFQRELASNQEAIEEAQKRDRLRPELLKDVSADIHAHLAHITSASDALIAGEQGPLQENQVEDIRIVSQAADRLRRIASDALALLSIIPNKIDSDAALAELTATAEGIVQTARANKAQKNATVSAAPQTDQNSADPNSVKLGNGQWANGGIPKDDLKMSPPASIKAGFSLDIVLAAIPFLLTAALLCMGIAMLEMITLGQLMGMAVAVGTLFAVQIAVIILGCASLSVRFKTAMIKSADFQNHYLRMLPVTVTAQLAAATILGAPTVLVVSAGIFGLDPGTFLLRVILPVLVAHGGMAIPTFIAIRTRFHQLAGLPNLSRPHLERIERRLLNPISVVVLPTVLATGTLWVAGEHTVEHITSAQLGSGYSRAAEAALTTGPTTLKAEDLRLMTRFDCATLVKTAPEHLAKQDLTSAIKSPHASPAKYLGMGTRELLIPIDLDSGLGFVHITPQPRPDKYIIGGLLVSAALLLSIAVVLRHRGQLSRALGFVCEQVDAFANSGSGDFHESLPKELYCINQHLERSKERFTDLCGSKNRVIEFNQRKRAIRADFFSDMSHDLRSPLNSIIGFTDLLLKGMEGPLTDSQHRSVSHISEQAQRLMVRIIEILDLSKIEVGTLDLNRSWVLPSELITDCIADSGRVIGTRRIVLNSIEMLDPAPVYVDALRIRQVVSSLVANITKGIKKGALTLKTTRIRPILKSTGHLRVDIIDTNGAISVEQKHNIEHAYRTALGVSDVDHTGTGVLSTTFAQDILRLHGGDLKVMSDSQHNALFTLLIPLFEQQK